MKKFIYTLMTASILGCSIIGPVAMAGQEQKSMLHCQIEAPRSVKAGSTVELKFSLTNTGTDKLAVLKWNTPLEGWFGSSFNVTRDGKYVNYTGAMVKRFRPSEEDYAQVEPGKTLSATVNMAEGYDIKVPGNYKLVFNGRLQDVQVLKPGSGISQDRKLQSVSCNELTVTLE